MLSASGFFNDGSDEAPKLHVYLNLDTIVDLRAGSIWTAGLTADERDSRLQADGFNGVQLTNASPILPDRMLRYCGAGRINHAGEADPVAAAHADRGDDCLTVHAGWGLESDREISALVEAILAASQKYRLPIFLETHRATITQDIWRTVQIAQRHPDIRFNGDFSHYYCGQELPHGGMEVKLAFMEPVFARTGFMHGRIASPGSMQVPIDENLHARPAMACGLVDYLADFREMWTRSMLGFLRAAGPGDVLIFSPEILSSTYYYARLVPASDGRLTEESDRYAQALLYRDLAYQSFDAARCRLATIPDQMEPAPSTSG